MKLPWEARRLGPHSRTRGRSQTWTWHGWDFIAAEQPAIANLLHTASLTHGKGMQSYLTMMAVRLLEMWRVLKSTGSIYFHCDPTASHYLKLLMDSIFGARSFRNEVVWFYKTGGVSKRWFGRKHDTVLFYTKSDKYTFNLRKEKSYLSHKYGFSNVEILEDDRGFLHDGHEKGRLGHPGFER